MYRINGNAGFFSVCSTMLHDILYFLNHTQQLPNHPNEWELFDLYKPEDRKGDNIVADYFERNVTPFQWTEHIDFYDFFLLL